MADVNLTVDGKKITAPAGSLLIEACKNVGIEVPSFCYYPGLSLQGACRMCVVKVEKMPKLQTACTTTVTEGMVVATDSDEVRQARKAMVELLLGNHPLDCPVCDAGGECELQDMTYSYGASESKFIEAKNHKEEQQWSPVVYFDRPALHSVLPVRAGVRRGDGCLGAGDSEPRGEFGDRAERGRPSRLRRMRHVH
jgi:NADH-quinone oxidoreductase subunit G